MFFRTCYHRFFGSRVLAGPFAGMRYGQGSVGSVHFAKLLGTYELELRRPVEQLVALAPDVVINIGAAEGYYAVGLALRLPNARIIAFETDAGGRQMVGENATLNHVAHRLEILGRCAPADLAAALEDARYPAVVIDAEGAEAELLDPALVPALRQAVILVEVHDFIVPLGETLRQRFRASHAIEEIWSRPRRARDLPEPIRLMALSPWHRRAVNAMDERRPGPMRWFWLQRLAG